MPCKLPKGENNICRRFVLNGKVGKDWWCRLRYARTASSKPKTWLWICSVCWHCICSICNYQALVPSLWHACDRKVEASPQSKAPPRYQRQNSSKAGHNLNNKQLTTHISNLSWKQAYGITPSACLLFCIYFEHLTTTPTLNWFWQYNWFESVGSNITAAVSFVLQTNLLF